MRFLYSALLSLAVVGAALVPGVAAADGSSVYWGAYIQGAPFDMGLVDTFESHAGKRTSIITWGQPWVMNGAPQPFQTLNFQQVRDRGDIPMVNWGSWELGQGTNQPNFTLARIAGGAYDGYVTSWAQAAKAWGHPLMLRFDHEMNGWWYPWSEQLNNNNAGDYVRAWRHVHDIFVQQGATNVSWVWCINEVSPRSTPTSSLYPGDSYVDWSCMDGYNWGTDGGNAWQTFSQVLSGDPRYGGHNTYQELLSAAPSKPIMIGETASSENGGSKAGWITDLLATQIPVNFPQVKALIWFDWNGGGGNTWPIESSWSAQSAFAQGIASSVYATNQFANLNTAGVPPPASTSAPASSGNTATLTPTADTYTSWADPTSTAGGSATEVRADVTGTDTAYMIFDLSSLAGKTITSAALKVHTGPEQWAESSATFDVKLVYATDWKEQWMSYVNTVLISPTVLGSLFGASSPGTWYQANLTQLSPIQARTGGLVSVALSGRTGDVLIINTRESGADAPQLVIGYR